MQSTAIKIVTDLSVLVERLGHRFATASLLDQALTHPSVFGTDRRNESAAAGDYERLEFLGDRVLGLVIAEWLIERFPTEREGVLARRHAALVQRDALCSVAKDLGLGDFLRLSKSEADGGGRQNKTILADACEAVIGAVHLDGGFSAARGVIRSHWACLIDHAAAPPRDSKTALQEWAQARSTELPEYHIVRQTGPAHEPHFEVEVVVGGRRALGTGMTRRNAEKAAAAAFLEQFGAVVDAH